MNRKQIRGVLSPVIDVWFKIVDGFTWVVTRIVLFTAFFTVFLAYGVILRLINKDPMNRTINQCDSYWTDNSVNNKTIEEFKNSY